MAWKGNTNNSKVPNNFNNQVGYTGASIPVKREEQIKREDKFPKMSMGLYQIDETIIKYINEILRPTVIDNGNVIPVPVIYGSPERWKSVKIDGYFRDKNGKIQRPVIMLKRIGFSKNEQLITFNRYLSYTVQKKYSEKNQYDQFSVLNRRRMEQPITEFYNITLPDHITINYEFMVWTDFVEQNNEIIESINFSSDDYWGEKTKYKFRTEISDYTNQVEIQADQERLVRTSFNLTVYAHLLPEKDENSKETIQKMFSPKKIIISEEIGDIPEEKCGRDDDIFVDPNKNKKNLNKPIIKSDNKIIDNK